VEHFFLYAESILWWETSKELNQPPETEKISARFQVSLTSPELTIPPMPLAHRKQKARFKQSKNCRIMTRKV